MPPLSCSFDDHDNKPYVTRLLKRILPPIFLLRSFFSYPPVIVIVCLGDDDVEVPCTILSQLSLWEKGRTMPHCPHSTCSLKAIGYDWGLKSAAKMYA